MKERDTFCSSFCSNNSPNALELKCIEVWIISCTLFVFLSLLEYFVVLFGMRYEKHWRHKKKDLERITKELTSGISPPVPVQNPTNTLAQAPSNQSLTVPNDAANHHVANQRVDSLRIFGTGKVVPVPEKINPGHRVNRFPDFHECRVLIVYFIFFFFIK